MSIPPIEFLLDASMTSLQDLELASLNRSANLSKVLKRELDAWIEQSATAMLARWFADHREEIFREANRTVEIKPKKVDFLQVTKKSA